MTDPHYVPLALFVLVVLIGLIVAYDRKKAMSSVTGMHFDDGCPEHPTEDTCESLTGWSCPGRPGSLHPHCACVCHEVSESGASDD